MAHDFDMSAAIEADRRSRKEWADAISTPYAIRAAPVRVIATSPEATETQHAAFEADFNKFLAQQSNIGLQESAMPGGLTVGNVYLKIRTDGPSVEIPACEVEMSVHYPGCGCIVCGIAMAEGVAQSEADLGRQLDDAIGFVPMSPKPAPEPPPPSPIPARALRYGVAEPPLLEWPE